MNIRITSDGTPYGARVENADTGESIAHVTRIEITITPLGTTATITIDQFDFDITSKTEVRVDDLISINGGSLGKIHIDECK